MAINNRGASSVPALVIVAIILAGAIGWYGSSKYYSTEAPKEDQKETNNSSKNEIKKFESSSYSIEYPADLTVKSKLEPATGEERVVVSGSQCAEGLVWEMEILGPIQRLGDLPSKSDEEIVKFFESNYLASFDLEGIAKAGDTRKFSYTLTLGSSFVRRAAWTNKDNMVQATYTQSRVNYDNSTGKKINESLGSELTNPCKDKFDSVINSLKFKSS